MRKLRRSLAWFVFLTLAGAGSSMAYDYKICTDVGNCHNCDYYSYTAGYLFSIYWCSYP